MMIAVREAGVHIVRFMLSCGAPCWEREHHSDSWTALHLAAHLGHADIARLLIQHGATVNMLAVRHPVVVLLPHLVHRTWAKLPCTMPALKVTGRLSKSCLPTVRIRMPAGAIPTGCIL